MSQEHFIRWALSEWISTRKDINEMISTAHVVCRITDDLLSKLDGDDPEMAHIAEAISYIDSVEYQTNNPSFKDYLDFNRDIIDKYKKYQT